MFHANAQHYVQKTEKPWEFHRVTVFRIKARKGWTTNKSKQLK